MKKHQLTHSGHRPYECDVYNKTFIQKADMKTHQFMHGGQRPYA
jgi:KRAB domain-containing zinc finger protein